MYPFRFYNFAAKKHLGVVWLVRTTRQVNFSGEGGLCLAATPDNIVSQHHVHYNSIVTHMLTLTIKLVVMETPHFPIDISYFDIHPN